MNEYLKEYADKLKANGFTVYAAVDPHYNYMMFTDDGINVGYCQCSKYGCFSFSSVHKANKKTGTGFRTDDEVYAPTLEHARRAFVFAPHWAGTGDRKSVVKYASIEDAISDRVKEV